MHDTSPGEQGEKFHFVLVGPKVRALRGLELSVAAALGVSSAGTDSLGSGLCSFGSSPPSWCCWWLRLQSACSTLAQLRAWTLAFSPLLLRHLVRKPRAAGFELRLQQRRSDGCDGNNVIVMLARGSSEHLLASSTCFRYHSIIDMERPQLLPTITAMGVSAPFASLDTL